ncbi:MAG: MFS transporter [Candidatus Kerfeldbacteria bacterium]|nr:MFS transporter [Candidatus Kerfeldbacteria bacterium]
MAEKILSNVKKFYWFSFFSEWVFWIPVVVLFWQKNGLNLTQIMVLQAVFALAVVILEVPTGVVADRLGRKKSLLLGAAFRIIGFTAYALGFNFGQFMVAEVILAGGASFISGADTAFLYDSLKQVNKESQFKKVRGHSNSLGYLAAALTSIVGGVIAVYSLRLTWWLSVVGMICLFLVALTFIEAKPANEPRPKESYLKHLADCFKESLHNKNFLFLLFFYSILTLFARVSLWFYQPYMKVSGLDIVYFGIVWASFNLFAISGGKAADRIERYLGEHKSLWLIVMIMPLSLVFMSQWFVIWGLVFIFLQQFVRGFAAPVLEDFTHHHLPAAKRATLMSIRNMAGSLVFAILGPAFGYLADTYSLSTALVVAGVSCFILFAALLIWNRYRDNFKNVVI